MKYPITGFKTVEIMQEVDRGFSLHLVSEVVGEWSTLKDYAYILHDKDETRPHIHLLMRFNCSVPTSAILNKFDGVVEFEHLQKCHSWKSAMAYLTHRNRPQKYQYDDIEVYSNYDWKKDADDALNSDKAKFDALAEKIASGECRPFNYTNYITDVFYASYKRKIDALFQYKYDALALENKGDRNMMLMYVYGGSGTGKTLYAKQYCEGLGLSYYISSGGKNPLDNYGGQDAIILDDLRPSDYKFNEFLKLTDNHTSSMVSCRYYNKSLVWCKLIIITSPLKIEDFYSNMQESDGEQAKQLKRRFSVVVHITEDNVSVYEYDNTLNTHIFRFKAQNLILEKYRQKREEVTEKLKSAFASMGLVVAEDTPTVSADGFTQIDMLDDDLPF